MTSNTRWNKELNEAFSVDDEWDKMKNKGNSIPEEPEPEFDCYGTALNEL